MYLTVKALAEQLKIPEKFIMDRVVEGKAKTIFDGENILVNKDHFDKLMEIVEKRRKKLLEESNEPIPEDYDVKDED